MTATAEKANPALWDKVKTKVTKEAKGGKPGQWSARKAQLAVHDYKEAGGTYRGQKAADNHLSQWQHEDWGTKSGQESLKTGERYLPRDAREHLSDADYKRTSAKKRDDLRHGQQFSAQPKDVARKTAASRHHAGDDLAALPKTELMQRARTQQIPNRSKMDKAQLIAALSGKH